MKVKICGITTYNDALFSAQHGADMLGFNFFKPSPRYIEPDKAQIICDRLRDELGENCPILVGLFVNVTDSDISVITNKVGLDAAQLSGDESDEVLAELRGIGFKAIRPVNLQTALEDVKYFAPHFPENDRLPSLLLDAYHPSLYGGTGEQASTEVALRVKAQVPRLMLAGGLTPENVADRVSEIQPWGVDVASGVEAEVPGIKNLNKVRAFIEATHG